MFAAGIIAYRNNWLGQITPKMGKKWLGIGFASLLILFGIFALWELEGFEGGLNPAGFFYTLYESIMCVGMSIGLIALFQGRLNIQGKIAKAMAEDNYTVYLFHIPVLAALQFALIGVSIDPMLKFAIVLAIGSRSASW